MENIPVFNFEILKRLKCYFQQNINGSEIKGNKIVKSAASFENYQQVKLVLTLTLVPTLFSDGYFYMNKGAWTSKISLFIKNF